MRHEQLLKPEDRLEGAHLSADRLRALRHADVAPRVAKIVLKIGTRTYIALLGFYVRGGKVPQTVLDHLNDNRRYYSQAVWANADELTLSRVFANYTYAPPGS